MDHQPQPVVDRPRLRGRKFWESIGSPRLVLAPMVDQSEFAWRMLTRSFQDSSSASTLLSYTPMLHARLFDEGEKYRSSHFEPVRHSSDKKADHDDKPYLDGNPAFDRPLFVQFCANDPDELLAAARRVEGHCDAVDLNLGCPQGIAKKGNYGSFLQENQGLIVRLISILDKELKVPVTAKIRILETKEKTLAYAKRVTEAGASILTVHGRQRHQKGHNTGLADWSVIRYLRSNLPHDVVLFANGNILQHSDIERCLNYTGADGVMSAEGNLADPAIFYPPPDSTLCGREYWQGSDGQHGWRVDAVLRRWYDIIYRYVLEVDPPARRPLASPTEPFENFLQTKKPEEDAVEEDRPSKRRKKEKGSPKPNSPNLTAMKAHAFSLLRPLISKHTGIRDKLAQTRAGDMVGYEEILEQVERVVWQEMKEYESTDTSKYGSYSGHVFEEEAKERSTETLPVANVSPKLPPWICQAYTRPLPHEALKKGALQLSKKQKTQLAMDHEPDPGAGATSQPPANMSTEKKPVESSTDDYQFREELPLSQQQQVCG